MCASRDTQRIGHAIFGATVADAERLIENPEHVDLAPDGKWRYVGFIRGERVRVVVALDEPDLIVTIHRRRR